MTWWLDCKKVEQWMNTTNATNANSKVPCWNANKIRTELGYAAKLGFNFVRVFAHNVAFEQNALNKDYDFEKLEEFIEIARSVGIKYVMPVIFDSCSVGFAPQCTNASWFPVDNLTAHCWVPSPGY